MSWTKQRKRFVTLVTLFFIFGISLLIILPIFLKAPTCFDTIKNGDETDIDCGGSCTKVCQSDIIPLQIQWERSVKVDTGVYDAVGYLVNKNNKATPTHVTFTATLSDRNGATIAKQSGSSIVLPGSATPLYVPNIKVGEAIPVRTRFEITETGTFYNSSNTEILKNLQVVDQSFDNTGSVTKLSLTLENKSFQDIKDIDVYTFLFDNEDTLIAINKTYIQRVESKSSQKAYVSWRSQITTPARFEFILVQQPSEN